MKTFFIRKTLATKRNRVAAILISLTLFLNVTPSFSKDNGGFDEKQEKKDTLHRRWGIIDFSVSYLRESPDYESPLVPHKCNKIAGKLTQYL